MSTLSDEQIESINRGEHDGILWGTEDGLGPTLCDQAKEANRLREILCRQGVCESCGELYAHDLDTPFASGLSCLCGTSEWYDYTPYMKLQAEIYRLRQGMEANRLREILCRQGVCESCGELYAHDLDAPFASCLCGTSEWYDYTPYMKLQAEIYRLHQGMKALERRVMSAPYDLDAIDISAAIKLLLEDK